MSPFTATGVTVSRSASGTTANVALTAGSSSGGQAVRVYNAGAATVFLQFGESSAVEAETTTGIPVPAGVIEVYSIGPDVSHVAAITASGTATVYFTPGQGI